MGTEISNTPVKEKLSPLELIREIETKWPVETITSKGIQVWPYLRIYIGTTDDYFTTVSASKSNLFHTFFSSVFYGFGNIFRKHKYLFYSDTKERRRIGDKFTDKSFDHLMSLLPKSLDIEIPLPKHFSRREIPTKHIISKVLFYFIETVYAKLFLWGLKIKEKHVLDEVCAQYHLDINGKALIKRLVAQYVLTKYLIRFNRPKVAFIECYYTNIGRIAAFKKKGVKVIEVQHGVISKKHQAYNIFKKFDENCFPDYLFTFGESEKRIAETPHFYISPEKVIPVGSYYIDYLNSNSVKFDKITEYRSKYKYLVCVSGQNHYTEPMLMDFLNKTADFSDDILFVFVPRDRSFDPQKYSLNKNIVVEFDINCYEMISVCDFHSTIYSTCALEAPSLGVPNILINIEGLSKLHYGEVLNNPQTTVFVNNPEEFNTAIASFTRLDKDSIRELNKHVIVPGYKENIQKALKQISLL